MLNNTWDNIKNINDTKKVVFLTNTYHYMSKHDKESNIIYEHLCQKMILNKTYNVIQYLPNVGPNGRFRLDDDQIYPKELFIPLEEFRHQQINKLLNEK